MFDLLAGVLAFFYDLIPNYVVAISLLTLTVMAVLTPITLKGTRSMLAMQKLQPEMKRIQEAHKGDRQATNEAMMAFYKEHKINPLSGCLPMLAQFPVLMVMFRVINGLVKHATGDGKREFVFRKGLHVGETISDGVHGIVLPKGVRIGTPSYLSDDSALRHALERSGGRMKSFGVDFGSVPSAAGRGAVVLYLLIGLVVLTSYYQTRQMQARSPSANQMNPQMQTMTRIMPLFSGFISLNLPGGVTLYFLISNLFRITQQGLMYRFDPHLKAHMEEVREVKTREASQPPQPRKGLMASMREQAEGRGAQRQEADGTRTNGSGGAPTRPNSGRVTPSGQRATAARKRTKRKR
ncbi:MAG TPA: YidC/Oxa1 family membrane protein insertase [Acidimicrobiales bacterium]|nr:YidC/Oxa1 family membrane protein insertase [Acidimicrobiales bacterium]